MPDLDLGALDNVTRLLMTVPLRPVQGDRFQPAGFPSLGAATYQTGDGLKLLVESAQSMANRLETTCWDPARNAPVEALDGVSHVTVTRNRAFLTDSMLEAHRVNSPYVLNSSDRSFLDPFLAELRSALGEEVVNGNNGLINRNGLARVLVAFDIGSLIHGVFLSNKVKLNESDKSADSIAGGRLRVARALSAFIEASGAVVAASGGVKNDHVNPSGDTKTGYGNVPFARDEYVADEIDCHFNLDLAQIRGYGLDPEVQRLLVLLSLYRVRRLLDGDLRLRTACDLEPITSHNLVASRPNGFMLPTLPELAEAVVAGIAKCKDMMVHTTLTFEDELRKGKETTDPSEETNEGEDEDEPAGE